MGCFGAGNSTSTCTGRAPKEPNDINAVETNVQFSTDPTLAGSTVAVGYRQTYSQVLALVCGSNGNVSSATKHPAYWQLSKGIQSRSNTLQTQEGRGDDSF